MAAGMARGLLMLSKRLNHTGHTMEDTGMARGLLTLSQSPSPTTLVDTATVAIMARGLLMPSHTTWVDTTAAGMARGLLMLSQRPSHTTWVDTATAAGMARGLLMLSQRLNHTGHTM